MALAACSRVAGTRDEDSSSARVPSFSIGLVSLQTWEEKFLNTASMSPSVVHSMILCILHMLAFLPAVEVFNEGLRNQKQHLVVNTYTRPTVWGDQKILKYIYYAAIYRYKWNQATLLKANLMSYSFQNTQWLHISALSQHSTSHVYTSSSKAWTGMDLVVGYTMYESPSS